MIKNQELSLYDVIGEKKNQYEFSFITTFNAYLPFYEQIVLRRLVNAGCRVNTVLIDAGEFASSFQDNTNQPLLAGRDFTLVPIDAGRGVFHPKILLLLGRNHAALCIGSHNLTLSGFGKNRELTTVYLLSPKNESGEQQIFRDVWKAMKQWMVKQPAELLDPFLFVEKEIPWLTDVDEYATEHQDTFFSSNENLSLWEQIKPYLPTKNRRVILISPFFDDKLRFLSELKNSLNPKEFIIGIEPETVYLSSDVTSQFPEIKFVETNKLREGYGYLHAKTIYIETESGKEILINGSANASSPAWLKDGSRNYEAVVVLRSNASNVINQLGIKKLTDSPEITSKEWDLIRKNRKKKQDLFINKEKEFLLTAIETETGFKVILKKQQINFVLLAELYDVTGDVISRNEITNVSENELFIEIPDPKTRSLVSRIELKSATGEKINVYIHHTSAIVSKFHQNRHREFFAALENFDVPLDDKLWRLFEKIIFVEGDELPDYLDAQISHKIEPQNLKTKEDNSESLQETFSIKTAELSFKERLNQHSFDSVSELISLLNRRLYMPTEFSQKFVLSSVKTDDFVESEDEEYETEEFVDKKRETEKIGTIYYQRMLTVMKRMAKKLAFTDITDIRAYFATMRQLAVALGVIHWMKELEKSKRFSQYEIELICPDNEWRLFVAAVTFIASAKNVVSLRGKEIGRQSISEEISTVIGYLLWLGYDCGFDIELIEELRNQSYAHENLSGWTNLEILEGTACFLKLAVLFFYDKQAIQTFEESLKIYDSIDWVEKNIAWLKEINQISKNVESAQILNRKARLGDLVFLTKSKEKEILIVSNNPSHIEIRVLEKETKFRKYSSESVSVIKI